MQIFHRHMKSNVGETPACSYLGLYQFFLCLYINAVHMCCMYARLGRAMHAVFIVVCHLVAGKQTSGIVEAVLAGICKCVDHTAQFYTPLNTLSTVGDKKILMIITIRSPVCITLIFLLRSMARSGDEDGDEGIYQLIRDLVQFSRSRTSLPVSSTLHSRGVDSNL